MATNGSSCGICQDAFVNMPAAKPVIKLNRCGHHFCEDCLERWWQQQKSCPLCRTVFPSLRRCLHTSAAAAASSAAAAAAAAPPFSVVATMHAEQTPAPAGAGWAVSPDVARPLRMAADFTADASVEEEVVAVNAAAPGRRPLSRRCIRPADRLSPEPAVTGGQRRPRVSAGGGLPAPAARRVRRRREPAPVYEIDELVERRQLVPGGTIQYRVRWRGFDEHDDTWETEEQLTATAPEGELHAEVGAFLSLFVPI